MDTRHLYQPKHPINAVPFEALHNGSWCNVDHLRIKDGKVTIHFEQHGFKTEEKVPADSLRIRSRKANVSDCNCFLRPGVDVCVLLSDSKQSLQPVWLDAKISTIERKPHKPGCTCRFSIRMRRAHHPLRTRRNVIGGTERELSIDDIAILQQLDKKPCEDGHFRWVSSKDCHLRIDSRLFRGQFMYDVSWLVVASTLRGDEFEVSSVKNKMLYRVLNGDTDMLFFRYDKSEKVINFKVEGGIMRATVSTFVLENSLETPVTEEISKTVILSGHGEDGLGSLSPLDPMILRRSRRHNTQPDRYVSENFKLKHFVSNEKIETPEKMADDEPSCIILSDSDGDRETKEHRSKSNRRITYGRKDSVGSRIIQVGEVKVAINNASVKRKGHGASTARKRPRKNEVMHEQVQPSSDVKKNNKLVKSSDKSDTSSDDPLPASEDILVNEQDDLANRIKKICRRSSKGGTKQKKSVSCKRGRVVKKISKKKGSNKKIRRKLFVRTRTEENCSVRVYRKTILTQSEYKRIVENCMRNIDSEIVKHQHPVGDQWEAIKSSQWWKLPQTTPSNDPVENSELEDLWKQMEMSTHSLQLLEGDLAAAEGVVSKSYTDNEQSCQHKYVLDEQIGTVCQLCGSVGTEIRHISPSFLENKGKPIYMRVDQHGLECRDADELGWNLLDKPAPSRDTSVLEENASVWTLIPNLRSKLHAHQKTAFEFLWKNIAGSLMPANMDTALGRTGGCIISHSPGAGKTFLMISFLVSYLKLYPGKRPLILAPKTTLYTWYKEFKKWDVSVPLYQIHARKNYKKEVQNNKLVSFTPNRSIMHTVDCLQKFEKWHDHPSVLLMSYSTFLYITKGKSNLEHWRYMERILKQSPGLLILDEGHNPRSTKSRLRKTIMHVRTEHRILLSGTLFQNNFEEFFNTLCLARPRFIYEVLRKFAPKSRGNQYKKGGTRISKEKTARRFFLVRIENSIKSKVDEERRRGLDILKRITDHFIDVYEGGTSVSLPGLKIYKLLIKPSMMQQELLGTLQKYANFWKFRLQVQILVTLVSIHPWLIKSRPYSAQYCSADELEKLEERRLDVRIGSKVSFVLNLVCRCIMKKEKVLIFCRYMEPIKLFVDIFVKTFGWTKGDQVLVLNGKQELCERSRVIDKFEEQRSSSQVLIASISACSEGISLTAASRVVLLDSEWNPSKTKQAVARAFRPGQERVVHVYQLLASGTLEEDKYGRNTWKERVSRMIFVGSGTEESSCGQTEDIDDEVLKEIMKEDHGQVIHGIAKDDSLSGPFGM